MQALKERFRWVCFLTACAASGAASVTMLRWLTQGFQGEHLPHSFAGRRLSSETSYRIARPNIHTILSNTLRLAAPQTLTGTPILIPNPDGGRLAIPAAAVSTRADAAFGAVLAAVYALRPLMKGDMLLVFPPVQRKRVLRLKRKAPAAAGARPTTFDAIGSPLVNLVHRRSFPSVPIRSRPSPLVTLVHL